MDDIAIIDRAAPAEKITMPPESAKAVITVMKQIKQLGVDEKNQHGGYNYVSVDKFFDHVGRLMAEADIFDLVNEVSSNTEKKETVDSYGKVKVSNWLMCEYAIFLYHASGAQYGPITRTVQVAATGPQSYGSAMSFVEKYFLRGLFKIPTGEKDADDSAPDGLPVSGQRQPAKGDDEGFASGADRFVKNAKIRIAEFTTVSALKGWWADQDKAFAGFFDGEKDPKFQALRAVYIARGTALKASVEAITQPPKTNGERLTSDAIPY